jgi:anti-sigma regulatory factor (Ser/Thr protein kinase)
MGSHLVVSVAEESQIGEARRAAARLAGEAGFTEADGGRASIVASELATNLLRHAKGGELLLHATDAGAAQPAVEILAADKGPGMANVERCLEDGYSTNGTAGNGLGAVRRLSSEFDMYSGPSGTVVFARLAPAGPGRVIPGATPGLKWGAVSVPAPGETVCGDAWRLRQADGSAAVLVADGLGHGPFAAEAAQVAVRGFDEDPFVQPRLRIESAHRAMSGTRGAAVAVARLETGKPNLTYAGVGNISGTLLSQGTSRGLVSHNGIVGHQVRKVQEFEYPWGERGLLVLHSDGLQTRWALDTYPGLAGRHPGVIAGVLYRDFKRGRDDVTVVVISPHTRQG